MLRGSPFVSPPHRGTPHPSVPEEGRVTAVCVCGSPGGVRGHREVCVGSPGGVWGSPAASPLTGGRAGGAAHVTAAGREGAGGRREKLPGAARSCRGRAWGAEPGLAGTPGALPVHPPTPRCVPVVPPRRGSRCLPRCLPRCPRSRRHPHHARAAQRGRVLGRDRRGPQFPGRHLRLQDAEVPGGGGGSGGGERGLGKGGLSGSGTPNGTCGCWSSTPCPPRGGGASCPWAPMYWRSP